VIDHIDDAVVSARPRLQGPVRASLHTVIVLAELPDLFVFNDTGWDAGRLRLSQGASLKPDQSEGCSPVFGGRTIRREREKLLRTIHNGGSRASLRAPTPHHHDTVCFPHTLDRAAAGSLHGEDFPRTLMRGSPDGTVEPVRNRQETV
jgi:hypothetical protein